MRAPDHVAAQLETISTKLDRVCQAIDLLLVKRPTREAQAKMAGVSRATLWRREKRLKINQRLNKNSR